MLLAAPAASAATVGWGRPVRLVAPFSLDLIPPQAAFSTTGAAALGFGVQDVDNPGSSAAFAASGAGATRLGPPRRVRGAQRTLALAYQGTKLVTLVGSSPRGLACCSAVSAATAGAGGGFGALRKLLTGQVGLAVARLVSLPGRLLAAIATERGVWVSQSGGDGRFGPTRRLTGSDVLAEALDATTLVGNQSVVAWAATNGDPRVPGASTPPGARSILIARGSVQQAPRAPRAVITVPADHWIDELALAANGSTPTVVWIESWYDAAGRYQSQVQVADVGATVRPITVSLPGELASGIAFSADAKGDQLLAWKGCALAGTCVLRAALRPAGSAFGSPQLLGSADASQAPAAAVGPSGQPLVTWIQNGHVLGAAGRSGARRLDSPKVVSSTGFAADLSLTFSASGQALATWTQGTLAQSVIGAVYQTK